MRMAIPLVTLLACSKPTAPPEGPVASSSVQAEGDTQVMHDRLTRLTAARDSVIHGRHDEARSTLQTVADETMPGNAPGAWRVHLQDMRDLAAAGAESSDAQDLAEAVSGLARTCGSCHAQLDATPRFVAVPTPAADQHMAAHAWAADRMWEGLIGPDTNRWIRASTVLRTETAEGGSLYAGLSLEDAAAAAQLHQRVHDLGESTAAARSGAADRASVYAALIQTCATCHARTRQ